MSPALLFFWDELDCACTLLRLAWRYARIVLTNVFLVHALFAYAACGRNMLTQVWYAFCCNVMLCIYHAIYFSTFVFRHSYVCTEVWSTHCWPVAIVPTGLQYFFCIGSKHNPQEFLTSRFPFSKARCGYIAVGNWDNRKTTSENWCRNLMPKKRIFFRAADFHRFWIDLSCLRQCTRTGP